MKLPVMRDPRPQFVLFSWAATDGSFRFALIRDPELGGRRNDFLDAFDHPAARPHGLDLSSLEHALSQIPKTSVVEWWVEDTRHLSLPSPDIVQRIRQWAARRHLDLHVTDADKAMA